MVEQKEVKANKEHGCDFCREKIKKDEVYIKSTYRSYGSLYDWKSHLQCFNIADRLKMYDDCDEGLTTSDFQNSIDSEYFKLLIAKFSREDYEKYIDVIQQLHNVEFKDKLKFVIRYYAKFPLT
jgi:hypothetical protein